LGHYLAQALGVKKWGNKMKMIAAPVLAQFDDSGAATLIKGNGRIKLPTPQISKTCLDILRAFENPGQDPEVFVSQFSAEVADGINELISLMKAGGFLVDEHTPLANPENVFWSDYGQTTEAIDDAVTKLDVTLVGHNRLSTRIADSLGASGIFMARCVDDPNLRGPGLTEEEKSEWVASAGFRMPEPADDKVRLVIASTDIGAETYLRAWNEFCVENKILFLPVSIKGNQVCIGPFVRPFETGCFECARGRVNSNGINLDRSDEAHRPVQPAAFGWHPLLLDTAAMIVCTEVLRQAVGALPPLKPDLIVADPMGKGIQSRHRVLRLPRCPICSPIRKHATPIVVDSEDRDTELMEAFK
jgi:bacteriocin biosynthesis cyclodehydratase domain-containing protein